MWRYAMGGRDEEEMSLEDYRRLNKAMENKVKEPEPLHGEGHYLIGVFPGIWICINNSYTSLTCRTEIKYRGKGISHWICYI